jgi:hypothetical protein
MAAAHLKAGPTPTLVTEAYRAGYRDGHKDGLALGCTGTPQTREGALQVIERTRKGWPVRCRYCAAWHVHQDQERQSEMVRPRYHRPRAVPCLEQTAED